MSDEPREWLNPEQLLALGEADTVYIYGTEDSIAYQAIVKAIYTVGAEIVERLDMLNFTVMDFMVAPLSRGESPQEDTEELLPPDTDIKYD
jgi:hypothetical protein